jgi:tRNA A37 threonylcarbamoyladenosine modification protein TsaB
MVLVAALVLFGIVVVIIVTVKVRISIGLLVGLAVSIIIFLIFYTHLTLFVIPPGAEHPQGSTLIISRTRYFNYKTSFVDSVERVCRRTQGVVSPFCLEVTSQAMSANSKLLMKLPYNRFLHHISNMDSLLW